MKKEIRIELLLTFHNGAYGRVESDRDLGVKRIARLGHGAQVSLQRPQLSTFRLIAKFLHVRIDAIVWVVLKCPFARL